MKWFKKWFKKLETSTKETGEVITKLNLRIIDLAVNYRVTRLDYIEALLLAVLELHPEIKGSSSLRDYESREKEYKKELEGLREG